MKWFQILSFWLAMGSLLLAGARFTNAEAEPEKAIANARRKTNQAEAKPINIPLEDIWAYGMPETRDVRELVAASDQLSHPLGVRVGGQSSFILKNGKKIAGPGFAVRGTGMEALLATHTELPEGRKSRNQFPKGSEISVVFFSHGFESYVHIHQVERKRNAITIRYWFVPHETKNMSSHFALIPIGKLPIGNYQVEIIRSPMERKYVDAGFKAVTAEWERKIVCKSFSFEVR